MIHILNYNVVLLIHYIFIMLNFYVQLLIHILNYIKLYNELI
jgi:hypothetical protein